jgi:hypothetical protein
VLYVINFKKRVLRARRSDFFKKNCVLQVFYILKTYFVRGLQEGTLGLVLYEAKFQQDGIYEVFYSVRK